MNVLRIWLPAAVCLTGLVIWGIRRDLNGFEAACAFIGAGASIWLLNLLHRIGVSGDVERDEEEAAREHFTRTGHWPDEET